MINIFGKLYTLLRRPQATEPSESESSATEVSPTTEAEPLGSEEAAELGSAVDQVNQLSTTDSSDEKAKASMTKLSVSQDSTGWEHVDRPENLDAENELHDLAADLPAMENISMATKETSPLTGGYVENIADDIERKSKDDDPETVNEDVKVVTPAAAAESVTDETNVRHDDQCTKTGQPPLIKLAEGKREGHAEDDKKTASQKHGKEKVCNYYWRGQKCWKGPRCKFAHVRASDTAEEDAAEAGRKLCEADFPTYTEFVQEKTMHSQLITPKDLVYKLGYQQNTNQEVIGEAIVGQYKLAVVKQNWQWVGEVRYFSELFFPAQWIDEHLPHKHSKGDRKRKSNNKAQNKNERYEKPGTMCRDVRLKEHPELERVVANAGDDQERAVVVRATKVGPGGDRDTSEAATSLEFGSCDVGEQVQTDNSGQEDTDVLIKQAMKMAISDGLSESVIMEVIDDVTSGIINTPGKPTPRKAKLAKVDLNRTPRKRPDQLAVGFNYHADLVVQNSPKTVKGEIIVIDTLPPARERPEQLAVGFSFLADQLVKEAPRSETGEPIIPGIPLTPRRRARDQLAMGFNYHSNLMLDDVQQEKKQKENESSLQQDVKSPQSLSVKKILGEHNANTNNNESSKSPSGKNRKKVHELLAMGFSYSSDLEMLQTADKLKSDVVDNEELNNVRLADEAEVREVELRVEKKGNILSQIGTPAGSVW